MEFCSNDFFSKYENPYLQEKSLMENFVSCAVVVAFPTANICLKSTIETLF